MPGEWQGNQAQNISLTTGHIYCHSCQVGVEQLYLVYIPGKGMKALEETQSHMIRPSREKMSNAKVLSSLKIQIDIKI